MKKLSFFSQLVLCFVAPAVLFCAALAATFWGLWSTQSGFRSLMAHEQAIAGALRELQTLALRANQAVRDLALDRSNKDAAQTLTMAHETLPKDVAHAAELARGSEFADPLTAIGALIKEHIAIQQKIVLQVRDSPGEVIMTILMEETPLWAKLNGQLAQQMQAATERAGAGHAATEQRSTQSLVVAGAFAALALVVCVALSLVMVRTVRRELGGDPADAKRALLRVAEGDLRDDVVVPASAAESLMAAVQKMQASMRGMVGQVRQSSDSIGTASSEIATGNQDLSTRTEQTAANLQQTASSMEQLTGTLRQSADAARQANQLASSAAEVAERGGSVVSQVVATMDEINTSSKKISDIIGTIDGIAFQTNILALNAAVEAARAGEQGRGFAVVAAEVRSLAQRSAEAAKEIKALIGASVGKVASGSRLVADAGSTMTEIVASVKRVTDIIGEITAASSEQSEGIGQVNTAVGNLDQMTQQNAALVEESAAAAESLRQQAHLLAQAVSSFKLSHTA